jgi:cytoskeletal protein CcmA (bactofilin family)
MLACDAKEPPMFSKTTDPTSAPPRPTTGAPSNSRSILAADLKITGDVRSTGSVELLGEVDGTVSAHTLLIGNDGRMTGDISAEEVEIKGRHDGRVASQSFTLRASAEVKADIGYSRLVIESGAQIEGRLYRNKD